MNQTVRFREPLCRLAVIDEAFGQDRAGARAQGLARPGPRR